MLPDCLSVRLSHLLSVETANHVIDVVVGVFVVFLEIPTDTVVGT